MKVIFIFLNKPLVNGVEKSKTFPLLTYQSTNNLVIKIAVNKEVTIPINNVVAKPLIGPVPKTNNIKAVRPVVIFASKIEDKALAKPSWIEPAIPLPLESSSLIRSKISTFASTDIPIVSTIPANPGKVKTAPKPDNTPKINKMLSSNAMLAAIPPLP